MHCTKNKIIVYCFKEILKVFSGKKINKAVLGVFGFLGFNKMQRGNKLDFTRCQLCVDGSCF